jgi:diaminopropionate ammonia-lyase
VEQVGEIRWLLNEGTKYFQNHAADVSYFKETEIATVRGFHSSMPSYEPTPLRSLPRLAAELGFGEIYVKDESCRFGLNAFKVLGASYAIAKYLAGRLGMNISELPYDVLVGDEIRERIGSVTFATTTDGNHGRAVAWTARMLRQNAVVYMPKGSSKLRCDAIAAEGARVAVRDANYDESVRMTADEANEKGWVVVQDTAWPGYEDIPTWIMQGYGSMASEVLEQLRNGGCKLPTHIFLQAGVGSFAGAVQGFFSAFFGKECPKVVIAEADKADCYYRSASIGDGKPHAVTGDMDTVMAGLACGEPNRIAFDILRDNASAFVSCPDYVTARGMRMLGNPISGDPFIRSGESGAVTTGLLSFIAQCDYLSGMKDALKLGKDSVILLFSTEGDTDPVKYRRIVWDGELPTYDQVCARHKI